MDKKYNADDIHIGCHPDGYRIDKTASPLNRYTKWSIGPDGHWHDKKAVCFHELPDQGWVKTKEFDWESSE